MLPALLFEAAWNLSRDAVRRTWLPSFVLAFPGVIATSGIVAGFLVFVAHTDWTIGLLVGAIVSATDPIAVVAVVRRLRAPEELRTVMELESLVNDGVAAALYTIVVAAVSGRNFGPAAAIGVFFLATLGGAAIGYALAQAGALILRERGRGWLHILVTVVLAYGAFALAQRLDLSGIIAVIVCAYVLGTQELTFVDVRMHAAVDRFWAVVAIAANIIVFAALAVTISLRHMMAHAAVAAAAVAAVALARVAVAGVALPLVTRIPKSWIVPLILAGMRGGLSLALALTLPATIAERAIVIDAVAAVVVVTMLVPLALLAPWLRRHPPASALR